MTEHVGPGPVRPYFTENDRPLPPEASVLHADLSDRASVRDALGDQEFDSPKTLSAFALGLVLFVVTLILNIYALRVVKKYREAYE